MMNEALRAHVTRVGFDLSLARSHIAALVWLEWKLKHDKKNKRGNRPHALYDRKHHLARVFGLSVTATHGLIDRGLVTWIDSRTLERAEGEKEWDLSAHRVWGITTAGYLVIALLKESGIWQEYESAMYVKSA